MPVLILETESPAPPTQTLPPSPPGLLRKKTVHMMRSAATALTVLSDARTAHHESAGFLTGSEENHRSTGVNTRNLIFLRIHPVTSPPSPSVHTFTNHPIKPTSISFAHQTSGPSQTHRMAWNSSYLAQKNVQYFKTSLPFRSDSGLAAETTNIHISVPCSPQNSQ